MALLSWTELWIGLCFLAVVLALALIVSTRQRRVRRKLPQAPTKGSTNDKDRMLGLVLQAQGQLDLAFEHFQRSPNTPALQDNLNHLAQEFECQRQFKKAQAVRHHMATPLQNVAATREVQLPLPPVQALSGLQSGSLLGRYRVGKLLGRGAMGVVYLAQDTQADRTVALKTMALSDEFEGANLLDARERFFREAQAAGRLAHPNIVTVHDFGEDRGLAFIAMEFIEGQDLVAYCKPSHLLARPLVISIAARVADALACAHAKQVVHRDIKPANVMYDIESDTVKVMDFGIARLTDANKTRTGLVMGTPSFMSPEQLAGKKVDGCSDLYSLGVMLYQLLTGTLPFRGGSLAVLMHKITHERAPDIRCMLEDAPSELAGLVAKALEKDPQMRYLDGQQMACELRTLLLHKRFIDLEI